MAAGLGKYRGAVGQPGENLGAVPDEGGVLAERVLDRDSRPRTAAIEPRQFAVPRNALHPKGWRTACNSATSSLSFWRSAASWRRGPATSGVRVGGNSRHRPSSPTTCFLLAVWLCSSRQKSPSPQRSRRRLTTSSAAVFSLTNSTVCPGRERLGDDVGDGLALSGAGRAVHHEVRAGASPPRSPRAGCCRHRECVRRLRAERGGRDRPRRACRPAAGGSCPASPAIARQRG